MKKYFGLILFALSLNASAASNSLLFLRAMVHETYQVNVSMENGTPKAKIRSNTKKGRPLPKSTISKHNGIYLVSVTHP